MKLWLYGVLTTPVGGVPAPPAPARWPAATAVPPQPPGRAGTCHRSRCSREVIEQLQEDAGAGAALTGTQRFHEVDRHRRDQHRIVDENRLRVRDDPQRHVTLRSGTGPKASTIAPTRAFLDVCSRHPHDGRSSTRTLSAVCGSVSSGERPLTINTDPGISALHPRTRKMRAWRRREMCATSSVVERPIPATSSAGRRLSLDDGVSGGERA